MLASAFILCFLFIQEGKERFSAALGSLSSGRIMITGISMTNLKLALAVAIRFSAARRQFGPTEDEEIPVLEYQTQVNTLECHLQTSRLRNSCSELLQITVVTLKLVKLKLSVSPEASLLCSCGGSFQLKTFSWHNQAFNISSWNSKTKKNACFSEVP